jgi:Ala-tRNA(Pro) deacylase
MIAPTLRRYLDQTVTYDTLTHPPTHSALQTAAVCHLPSGAVAKGVLLRRGNDFVLAALPASHRVCLSDLRAELGTQTTLAAERDISALFSDCAFGAVPAIGDCYFVETLVDRNLDAQPHIYVEGGDHGTLIHLDHEQFSRLMAHAQHGNFSTRH